MDMHISPGISDTLLAWEVSPTSSSASAARVMFQTWEEFTGFFGIIGADHRALEEGRYGDLMDFAFILALSNRLLGDYMLAERKSMVPRVAMFIRLVRAYRYAGFHLTTDEARRVFRAFTLIDADYALSAMADGYLGNASDASTVFSVVERFRLRGVPAKMARHLHIASEPRFWDEAEAESLVKANVSGKYAWRLRGFDTAHIISFGENGVPADYAIKLHRSFGASDPSIVNLLHREGVPLDYALAGCNAGLDAEGVLRYHDEGIVSEFMVASHV
jgi:hypothetical protein